jgi:hypothetical protein
MNNKNYALPAMKKILCDDYAFHQSKTVDEIKKILETGEFPDNDTVLFVLQAGNLDIEININCGEYLNDVRISPVSLEYFCCVCKDGEWASFEEIPTAVNLDAPDLEAEMFHVLENFAATRGLSFFASNDDMFHQGETQVNDAVIEMS